ncbi:hypothetical protein DC74_706 [Streptomyces noursei]|nr:hypothetical protein DC74_706 [Streptomyces noursei]
MAGEVVERADVTADGDAPVAHVDVLQLHGADQFRPCCVNGSKGDDEPDVRGAGCGDCLVDVRLTRAWRTPPVCRGTRMQSVGSRKIWPFSFACRNSDRRATIRLASTVSRRLGSGVQPPQPQRSPSFLRWRGKNPWRSSPPPTHRVARALPRRCRRYGDKAKATRNSMSVGLPLRVLVAAWGEGVINAACLCERIASAPPIRRCAAPMPARSLPRAVVVRPAADWICWPFDAARRLGSRPFVNRLLTTCGAEIATLIVGCFRIVLVRVLRDWRG